MAKPGLLEETGKKSLITSLRCHLELDLLAVHVSHGYTPHSHTVLHRYVPHRHTVLYRYTVSQALKVIFKLKQLIPSNAAVLKMVINTYNPSRQLERIYTT